MPRPAGCLPALRPRLAPVVLADPVVTPLAEPLAPKSVPTESLPAVASKESQTAAGARLVSAAELAMVLAKSAPLTPAATVPVVESPAPAYRDPRPADIPPLSKLSFRRRGFNRPAAPIANGYDDSAVGDSEVIVITRVAERDTELVPPPNVDVAKPAPRLLRRLKQIEQEENFSADGYAAYRGEVEEASVTIIGSQDGPAFVRRLPVQPPVEEQRTVNRFLKALTGKS